MSIGLRVWAPDGRLRLDTRHRTMRLTSMIYVAARSMPGGASNHTQTFSIPGFAPAVDGLFLNPGSAGYLNYEGGGDAWVTSGYLPDLTPVQGGARLTWRAQVSGYDTIRYMACYLMVMKVF